MCCYCCREKLFCQSLAKLKEDVVKANTLVREANFLVQEMAKPIEFSVTLQIPASNLSPNRRVTILFCCHIICMHYPLEQSHCITDETFLLGNSSLLVKNTTCVWNSLPADLRLETNTAVFKRKLKSYLFCSAFIQ